MILTGKLALSDAVASNLTIGSNYYIFLGQVNMGASLSGLRIILKVQDKFNPLPLLASTLTVF